MMNNSQLLCIVTLVLSTFLSGCASHLNQVQSGFLGDYSKLKMSENYANTKVFHAKSFDRKSLAAIKEIKLVPFEIWIKSSSKDDSVVLNTQRLQELSRYFHDKLRRALQNDYILVDVASQNTLTIQGAFSNIKLTAPEMSVTDFIPVRLILNAGNAAYLNVTNQKDMITEVSIEVEFLFGKNSNRVFAMTATKQLDLTMGQSGDDGFKIITEVLDTWIDNFVKKLTSVSQTAS